MRIGLALKGDVHVGFAPVAIASKPHRPLYQIEDVERQEEHLPLLGGVDTLVVDYVAVYPPRFAGPKGAEEIQAESLRHQPALHYHRLAHGQATLRT